MSQNTTDEIFIKYLESLYTCQMYCFFPDEVIPRFKEQNNLTDEEVINILRYFLSQGWLKSGHFKINYFLRPGYVQRFPCVITARGLAVLKNRKG